MSKLKKPSKKQVSAALYIVGVVALVTLGVVGTLKYQEFISNVKEEGAAEYRLNSCEQYSDKEEKTTWLECDV